jgi:excisionase family DNA binding protein
VQTTAVSPADDLRPLRVVEAKQMSGLGINQIYRAIGRGEIPSIRVGRRILIPRKPFLAWLNGES